MRHFFNEFKKYPIMNSLAVAILILMILALIFKNKENGRFKQKGFIHTRYGSEWVEDK
jgi:hypothetical protein